MTLLDTYKVVIKNKFKDIPYFIKNIRMDKDSSCLIAVIQDKSDISELKLQSELIEEIYSNKKVKLDKMIYIKVLKVRNEEAFDLLKKSRGNLKTQDQFLMILEYINRFNTNFNVVNSLNIPFCGESIFISSNKKDLIINRNHDILCVTCKNKLLNHIDKKIKKMNKEYQDCFNKLNI